MQNIYEQLKIPEEDRGTSIGKEQGEFIYEFLTKNNLKKTLEVGLAYECSTAYIISATKSPHIAIDPYGEIYDNLGLKNLKKLGLDRFLIHKNAPSHIALPNLLQEDVHLEFVFIDGGHKFDEIFIDWYYSDLLLEKNGYVLFDDS